MLTRQRDENPIAKVLIIHNYIPFVKGKRYRKNSKDEQILCQEAKTIQGHNCKITLSTTRRFNSPNKSKLIIFKKTTVLDDKNSIRKPTRYLWKYQTPLLWKQFRWSTDDRIFANIAPTLPYNLPSCILYLRWCSATSLILSDPEHLPSFLPCLVLNHCLSSSNKLRFLFVVKDLVPVGRPCHVQITAFVEGEAIA